MVLIFVVITMKLPHDLQLFSTAQFPCAYLAGKVARNTVIDPDFKMQSNIYSQLMKSGFRRSGAQVYRPQCQPCKECISTRIPVNSFRFSKSQRRNVKKNSDLTVVINKGDYKPAYQALYAEYLQSRHDSDDSDDVQEFFEAEWCSVYYVEFLDNDRLLGVAVIDVLESGVSSVYTFFSPSEGSQRGLGAYAILWQIDYAKKNNIEYVYPGYWIENCSKMNYKSKYRPIEGYFDGIWSPIRR